MGYRRTKELGGLFRVDHDGETFTFRRDVASASTLYRNVPWHNGKRYWRVVKPTDWTALPPDVRIAVMDHFNIPRRFDPTVPL